jgi:hypothetical protein
MKPKGGRKIDAAEAVKRVDHAEKRQMGTPPEPYQQEPERRGASAKVGRAAVDEALRKIDKATKREASTIQRTRKKKSEKKILP